MSVYKSKFQQLDHLKDKGLLVEEFFAASSNYKEDTFKKDFTDLINEVMKLKGEEFKGILVDMRNFLFGVLPELQAWHKDEVYPKILELGINKMAIVTSPDVFASISAEQTFDEYRGGTLETRYFKDPGEAKEWLLS
jgi:hypothetical protein